jgi:hypothetical protein
MTARGRTDVGRSPPLPAGHRAKPMVAARPRSGAAMIVGLQRAAGDSAVAPSC